MLLLTALLAAYQVAVGVDKLSIIPIISYTIGFGTLLVACLMLIILGYGALENSVVAIISTAIPLGLSVGLVWEYVPNLRTSYIYFSILGFVFIALSHIFFLGRLSNIILTITHGIAGILILLLPIIAVFKSLVLPIFLWVSIGGGLIGAGGSLLYLFKSGNSLIPKLSILKIFPVLLLLATIAFVIGFTVYK